MEPAYFPTEADFRRWLKQPTMQRGRAAGRLLEEGQRQAVDRLAAGARPGVVLRLDRRGAQVAGREAYTIRFTPRRKGSIWSKVNVERFAALKADGQMTAAGERAYEENKAQERRLRL